MQFLMLILQKHCMVRDCLMTKYNTETSTQSLRAIDVLSFGLYLSSDAGDIRMREVVIHVRVVQEHLADQVDHNWICKNKICN